MSAWSAAISMCVAVGRSQFFTNWWTKGFSSSLAVTWMPLSVAHCMGLFIGQLATWQLALSEQASQGEREKEKDSSYNPLQPNLRVPFITSAIFYSLEVSHCVQPTRGGVYTHARLPESGDHWGLFRKLPTTSIISFSNYLVRAHSLNSQCAECGG